MDVRNSIRAYIADRCLNQSAVARKAGLTAMQMSEVVNLKRRLDANEMFRIDRLERRRAAMAAQGAKPGEIESLTKRILELRKRLERALSSGYPNLEGRADPRGNGCFDEGSATYERSGGYPMGNGNAYR